MKKCNLLIPLLLVLVLLVAGCAASESERKTESEPNPFTGNWSGTLDLTEYIKTEMKTANPDMEKYLNFEGLVLVFDFTFTEEEMTMSVNESAKQAFAANAKAAVAQMSDAMIADRAAEEAMTVDDLYALLGTNRDVYVNTLMETMNLDMVAESVAAVFALGGSYSYQEGILKVYYDDSIYETMEYVFEGEKLMLTASDNVNAFKIVCQKVQ